MKTGQFSRQKNKHWDAVKACQGTSTNKLDSKLVPFSLQNKGRKDAFPPQRNLFPKQKEKFDFLKYRQDKLSVEICIDAYTMRDILHKCRNVSSICPRTKNINKAVESGL